MPSSPTINERLDRSRRAAVLMLQIAEIGRQHGRVVTDAADWAAVVEIAERLAGDLDAFERVMAALARTVVAREQATAAQSASGDNVIPFPNALAVEIWRMGRRQPRPDQVST